MAKGPLVIKLSINWSTDYREACFRSEWIKAFGTFKNKPRRATRPVMIVVIGPDGKGW